MGHYKYYLQNEEAQEAKSASEFVNNSRWSRAKDGDSLNDCLNNFFHHEHIKKLVSDGNWDEVFNCWENDWTNLHSNRNDFFYGNQPGWDLDLLTDFLYLAGIDFWSNLKRTLRVGGLNWIEDEDE